MIARVARVAVGALLALVGLLTLVAFLSGHAFPGELFAFFRVQYALALAALAIVAAALRSRLLLAVALVLLALDVAALVPALTAGSRPDPSEPQLRMVVANVEYTN